MAKKRKGLPLKEVVAVTLTIMFVIFAGGIVLTSPLMDEVDKIISDAGISGETNAPNSENGTTDGDSGEDEEESSFLLEDYAGPLEFNDDDINSQDSKGYAIKLPILRSIAIIKF